MVTKTLEHTSYTIDATDQVLGRLASRIALLLRGKHRADFLPYREGKDVVVVKNIAKMRVSGKKMEQKKYYRHSGYPGGIKEELLKDIFKENPQEVLRRAVWGMLPKNRLRSRQIKRLTFEG